MIQDLREKIIDKWDDTSVKTKLIGGAVIIAIILIIIL
jgi:hypothetical protein|tara:strand:- start:52 stop:165 length:114 start_codon:yes stop_codon:yes gene_type:complete